MDRKPFIFLVKSYSKIDLLLSTAISIRSKMLINLQYVCLAMQTLSWLQLLPLGWPCSLLGAGDCTPACETPPVLNVPPGSSQPIPVAPDRKSHGVKIKDGRDLHASLLCKADHVFEQERSETWLRGSYIANLHPTAMFSSKWIFQSVSQMCGEHLELFKQ